MAVIVAEFAGAPGRILAHIGTKRWSIATRLFVLVLADKGPLETVLINLASNARDAMPQGGKQPGRPVLDLGFRDQILRFDRACAAYGAIRSAREAGGVPISIEDAMIAATAQAYGAQALATRNIRDFEGCGVILIDPWQPGHLPSPALRR